MDPTLAAALVGAAALIVGAGLAAASGWFASRWSAEAQREQWDRRVETRWDEHKRRLYTEFLSLADRLHQVSGDLADVRGDLAEDLASHMIMVEDHFRETEGDRMNGMSEEERLQFWHERYEEQLGFFKERRATLSEAESELRKSLKESVAELHIMVPEPVREQIDTLAELSQQTYYGHQHERQRERAEIRDRFISAVRTDLQLPSGPPNVQE